MLKHELLATVSIPYVEQSTVIEELCKKATSSCIPAVYSVII